MERRGEGPLLLKAASFNLERGEEAQPVLRKSRTIKDREKDDPLPTSDLEQSLLQGYTKLKPCDWRSTLVILLFEFLDGTAFFGVATNLITYLTTVLRETNSRSATNIANWTGTCYVTPLLGAFLADTVLGSYTTTLLSAFIYFLGMIVVTLSSLLPYLAPSESTTQSTVFYVGLYLVAFGSGGTKSSLLPLGADQFDDDDDNPDATDRKAAFIGRFYICLSLGTLASGTVIVWVQQNQSWPLGYGVAASCIAVALVVFLFASPMFRRRRPSGSPMKSVIQVLVASLRKMSLKVPYDSGLLHEVSEKEIRATGQQILAHTRQFRFLDKAAVVIDEKDEPLLLPAKNSSNNRNNPWVLCTVTQVEELKSLLRIVPIWLTSVAFSAAYCQISTTFVEQGGAMDSTVGPFSVPAATLPAVEVLFVVFWTTIYERVIAPAAARCAGGTRRRGVSTLQRVGLGRFLMVLAMAAAALTETQRLQKLHHDGGCLGIAWQLPQYFLIGGAEAMGYIGQLEFFYDQVPASMKSLGMAAFLLSIAGGNYLNSIVVSLVQAFTAGGGGQPGWIPEDLNEGHLDYFFWGMAAFSSLNLVLHLQASRNYTPRKIV